MYYFLPPDAVMPSPPLIPRRVSKSYENVKLKEQESLDHDQGTTLTDQSNGPPIPPRKGYENVELKVKEKGATSPGIQPPVPRKRARSPQPPKEYCPITPPLPRKAREKSTEKSKLFKVTSVPYCPVSPDSPQLLPREKNRSTPSLPLKESVDPANGDNPSPYYSLPPDSSPTCIVEFDTQFDDSGEEESNEVGEDAFETYLTLDEEILSKAKSREEVIESPTKCPPLPPKVRST